MRGAIIRGLGATAIIYLLFVGIVGAKHAGLCGSGWFLADALFAATFGIPVFLVVAIVCTVAILCIPARRRGVPQLWLAFGAVGAVVFFGGFLVAQFSKVNLATSSHTLACHPPPRR